MQRGMKITFGVGAGYKANGEPIDSGERFAMLERAKFLMVQVFGSYTVVETSGGWHSPEQKRTVEETGFSIFVTVPDSQSRVELCQMARAAGQSLKAIFEQEAVYVEIQPTQFELV